MTVEVYDWCGDNSWRSTRYEVSANGTAADVYHYADTAFYTIAWAANATVDVSFLTVGTDEDVTFAITHIVGDPDITSYKIYGIAEVTASLAAGVLTITAPLGAKLHIETNGERASPLILSVNPLKPTVVNYQTFDPNSPPASFADNERWYFGPGTYSLGNLFAVGSDVSIYLDGGAVVDGNWDLRDANGVENIEFVGPGILCYTTIDYATVAALPTFADKIEHCIFLGYDGVNYSFGNVTVTGCTIVGQPYFLSFDPVNHWEDVTVIAPWHYESNGLSSNGDATQSLLGTMTRCYSWVGDDNCNLGDSVYGDREVEECFFINTNAAAFQCGYWPRDSSASNKTITNCMAMMFNSTTEIDSVIRSLNDGGAGDTALGQFNYTFTNLRVVGPLDIKVLRIENTDYPFGATAENTGKFVNWLFDGFTVDEEPRSDRKSGILGLDYNNLPINIEFRNARWGGTLLTQRNFSDFITINQFRRGLSFGGRFVVTAVDICNTALSYIGERDRVTAIAPPDGSEEARQCARVYDEALNELLEMHNWSFNTKKIQLTVINADAADTDDPAWDYRYEIPDGMAEALAVLADGHTEDYIVGATRQPQTFHIKLSDTDDELRIYSKTPDAWLRYTVYLTDPNRLSRLAITALEWLIASKLAGTIVRGDAGETMKNRCLATFGKYLAEAKLKDARQRQVSARPDAPWLGARGTSGSPWGRNPATE